MKRKLSLILALSMMLSVVPMSTFATSDNRVVSIQRVAEDAKFNATVKLKEKDANEFAG
ncbi:hypothetical protein IZY60_03020, partial [Lutibacter sp. B2]|nr:hypothetical protein [Lutibacter sp. B2]